MLVGDHKIVVAQPSPKIMAAKTINNGWKSPNGTWVGNVEEESCNAYHQRSHFRPCVFDVVQDPREERDLAAARPELRRSMWALLNRTQLTAFHAKCPARLLGPCDAACAAAHWQKLGAVVEAPLVETEGVGEEAGQSPGPICDVPGCGATA